jgi:hypothetical protein
VTSQGPSEDASAALNETVTATARALAEVQSRGRDGTRFRFRGRILLELRCSRHGHLLASVYPTSLGPLLLAARGDTDAVTHSGGTIAALDQLDGTSPFPRSGPRDPFPELNPSDVFSGNVVLLNESGLSPSPRLFCPCGQNAAPQAQVLRDEAAQAEPASKLRRVICPPLPPPHTL